MGFLSSLLDPFIRAATESPLVIGAVAVIGAGVAIGGLLMPPHTHQKPDGLKWTQGGIDFVLAVNAPLYESVFGSPKPGDPLTPAHLDLFFAFNIFTDQMLSRGLASGSMAPRKFGVLGYAFDFLAMAGIFYTAIFGVSTIVFGLGKFGLLTYARAPLVVAAHSFCYLYCLLHTAFVVGAHIGMFAGAKAVVAYNNGEGAPPNGVPEKSYHYVMWCEQAAGDKPKGSHPYDAHTWPPLVYIPPLGVPHYMRGYLLVDLPGIALLLVGSPKAYAAIWGCYLCAALTDHLTLFGGQFKDRIKTVLPVGGINMAQYAFWTVATHLTRPGAADATASFKELGMIAAVAVPVHLAMMAAIGARPSRRGNGDKKSA